MKLENKLYKYYKNELKKYNGLGFNDSVYFIGYIITYLRYKRDLIILTDPDINPTTNIKLASICLALAEYDDYVNCIYNYYDISANNVKCKKIGELTNDEILAAFQKEKARHWNTFCELVRINMENWLA